MFICFKCLKKFSQIPILLRHLKVGHIISSKLLQLRCKQDNCNQLFSSYRSFQIHLEKQHPICKHIVKSRPLVNEDCSNFNIISNDTKKSREINQNVSFNSLNNTENTVTLEETSSILEQTQFIFSNPTNDSSIVLNNINNLKKRALYLTLCLHSQNCMPRKLVTDIQKMISDLLSTVSIAIEDALSFHQLNEVKKEIQFLFEFCNEPFSEIKSEYRLLKILTDSKLYEKPKSLVINNSVTETSVNGNLTLASKSSEIYIMPLHFQFKSIFEIPNLLNYTLERVKHSSESNVFENFASGELFEKKKKKLIRSL